MARHKVYLDIDEKQHPIVKALKKKGHTNIKLVWIGAHGFRYTTGWTIMTAEKPHTYYPWQGVGEILNEINTTDKFKIS